MALSQRYRLLAPLALVGAAAMVLSGCAEGDTGGSDDGSLEGATVQISGGITGTEADALQKSFEKFTEDTGVEVVYTGDKGFEGNIVTKVAGGSAPDIAIVPQPGLFRSLVETGEVAEGSDEVAANVDKYWAPAWKDYGSVDGTFYAAPMLANLKGYIYYSPASFKEWGVEIPTTWEELLELTATIQEKTGEPPWCAGFSSEAASGWPGTDWIEDLVLRQSGEEVYNDWAAGDVEFTDPKIESAFDEVAKILLDPKYVNAGFGDVKSINSTAFGDPIAAAVAEGKCALTHQASFLTANFLAVETADGETPEVAEDGDVYAFLMPGFEGQPFSVSGGGEFVTTFSDDAATRAVAEYMSTPEWADERVKLGGAISANSGADPSLASSKFLTDAMTIVQDPETVFGYDASDLMPATVGSGSFWRGMVDWIDGKPTTQVLSDIQAGYEN
ncbi:carbohydrate ABC transporter substrate-binding protein [Microbacterium bovistercoris]|uniref:Carbohydrate ABC transporter substrate-binding protein n=1 Tax=Microbacterium bovistercoris TaxID=2293570 RepID=A0A371NU57_9MICO|nr:ABC transporter substrate-binding protein [Microbacterium bovistercoris]REJ05888.1 carbohydrate ABC transporter substrate-binding protein [Microbacterium bovistercoris]